MAMNFNILRQIQGLAPKITEDEMKPQNITTETTLDVQHFCELADNKLEEYEDRDQYDSGLFITLHELAMFSSIGTNSALTEILPKRSIVNIVDVVKSEQEKLIRGRLEGDEERWITMFNLDTSVRFVKLYDENDCLMWDTNQFVEWLCNISSDVSMYADIFESAGYDGSNVLTINLSELKDLGIRDILHRRVIMNNIEELKKNMLVRMDDSEENVSSTVMHGKLGNPEWYAPIRVVECNTKSRKAYTNVLSHEYEDDPRTLREKVQILAQLLQQAQHCVAYTGAGLSTSSGIADYASRAGNSKIYENQSNAKTFKLAQPSLGHRILAQLAQRDLVENWVQQNHDGLPQKAGFPQHRINEIHGAWFDPSNPVVPMSGKLRGDLFAWMRQIARDADLSLAIGTSLSGMNADMCFTLPCARYGRGKGLGGVIISIQRTQHDEECSLRIYSKIDEVLSLLARELDLDVPPLPNTYELDIEEEARIDANRFRVPYDQDGNLTDDPSQWIIWDLQDGSKVKITDGPGIGFEGEINGKYGGVHWLIAAKCQRQGDVTFGKVMTNYTLGVWWVETAVKGLWPKLPVVNMDPQLQVDFDANQ